MKIVRIIPLCLLYVLGGPEISHSQAVRLPAPDKDGWIKLFRGDNASDFYARLSGNINNDAAFPNNTFKVIGDTIQTTGRPTGHLAFKQVFSHYQFKMEMMIPSPTNCGLLLHVRDEEAKMGDFPRSVEFQGDPGQGLGELWTISNVYVNVKVRAGAGNHTYDSTGTEVTHPGTNGERVCHQSGPTLHKGNGQWNQLLAVVHGADSVSHLVNGVRVMRYTRLRVGNNMNQPLNSGRIAVQSEGNVANYRNMYIRLLPGDPLYTPTYAEFNRRNTIRPPVARKVLILEDGVLGVREPGSAGAGTYDLGGRLLPGQRIKTPG